MHLSLVSMEVIAALRENAGANNCDGDLAVQCALLHDIIEDTRDTYEDLAGVFRVAVANGVQALTKNKELPDSLQMEDSLRRIKQQPKAVWMVKLADRITNLQPPPSYWSRDKKIRYRDEARQIHAMLKEGSDFLATRLLTKIEGYGEYCS